MIVVIFKNNENDFSNISSFVILLFSVVVVVVVFVFVFVFEKNSARLLNKLFAPQFTI